MDLFDLGSEVEIPEWIGLILHSDDLLKGAGHKYIRRVPTGNPKKPWKYFYKVSGGEGLGHHSEFIEGAAFKVAHGGKEGHFHILGVDGDKLRIKHDESGEESTLTKPAMASLLYTEHAKAISEHKERLKKELVAVYKHGSEKQKAKIQSEATKAGVDPLTPFTIKRTKVKTNPVREKLSHFGSVDLKNDPVVGVIHAADRELTNVIGLVGRSRTHNNSVKQLLLKRKASTADYISAALNRSGVYDAKDLKEDPTENQMGSIVLDAKATMLFDRLDQIQDIRQEPNAVNLLANTLGDIISQKWGISDLRSLHTGLIDAAKELLD